MCHGLKTVQIKMEIALLCECSDENNGCMALQKYHIKRVIRVFFALFLNTSVHYSSDCVHGGPKFVANQIRSQEAFACSSTRNLFSELTWRKLICSLFVSGHRKERKTWWNPLLLHWAIDLWHLPSLWRPKRVTRSLELLWSKDQITRGFFFLIRVHGHDRI